MFAHDPGTNRLSLVGEAGPPWIGDDNASWNYCVDCWERFFSTVDKVVRPVPFRDKASQGNMVVSWRDRKRKAEELSDDEIDRPSASQNSQGADPETDAGIAGPGAAEGEESRVVDDEVFQGQEFPDSDEEKQPANEEEAPPGLLPKDPTLEPEEEDEEQETFDAPVVLPTERRPTLQEYKARWAELLQEHSRAVQGGFSTENLCPTPIHQLWQDCAGLTFKHALELCETHVAERVASRRRGPYVPFHKLTSPDSQARLSVCRPISGLQENSFDGMERYAHMTGSVFYRKRAIWQLASTMGWVVSKNTGGFIKLRPTELEALHEILIWGSQPGQPLKSK